MVSDPSSPEKPPGQLPYIPLKATHSKASSSPCPSQAYEQAAAHVAGHQRCSNLQDTSGVKGQGSVLIRGRAMSFQSWEGGRESRAWTQEI